MASKDPLNNTNESQQSSNLFSRFSEDSTSRSSSTGDPFYRPISPNIELPKGGGSVKGIDEKFSVNASNGTASLSVSLPFSPGRNGFTPALSLSYNSGSGNSEFGLGWSLSLPSIQRKTDKSLPKYQDAIESDVFLFSGAEDLIPYEYQTGESVPDFPEGYIIKRYRPRIEGIFAKIEHIKHINKPGESWWRVISADNITTYFGLSSNSRISDPEDNTRIFSWLPDMVLDNNGNIQLLEYKAENINGVLHEIHESQRLNGDSLFTNRYLKTVRYCNEHAYYVNSNDAYTPELPSTEDFKMEAVFDYGDQADIYNPTLVQSWPARNDAFSSYRAGFEIRNYRRCKRVLMYHRFPFEGGNGLVRSMEFEYLHDGDVPEKLEKADFIVSVRQKSYQFKNGVWHEASLPPVTYNYQDIEWDTNVYTVSEENIQGAPQGLTGPYQWLDFEGEGISGIFTEQGEGWFYKNNLGEARFTPQKQIAQKPSFTGMADGRLSWEDLDADGRRQVVSDKPVSGFWELDDDQQWISFQPFDNQPNIDRNSPFCKFLDLNGDGKADMLITEDRVWTWYENTGKKGFITGGQVPVFTDEDKGPVLLLRDTIQSIFLADMTGDGLTDLVRITNGLVCYWPNLGYGRFGAKVTMSNAPVFIYPDIYNPVYISLADITGSGVADLVYIGDGTCKIWLNLSGNGWSDPVQVSPLPATDLLSKIAVVDFLGNGTACLVWSSPLPQHSGAPVRYIDLMGSKKPFLLKSSDNGMGLSRQLVYKSSSQYYTEDKLNGIEWATKLPFPVHCVSEVTTYDSVSQTRFKQTYRYRHGYYDHEEREYRGFGYTETTDTDKAIVSDNSELDQSPVITKQWFHTGAWIRELTLIEKFREEYFPVEGWDEFTLIANLPDGLSTQELREAHRALKGLPLREEIYASDDSPQSGIPYIVTANAYLVQLIQHQGENRYASFIALQEQQLSFSCERNSSDPRVVHSLTLETDKYGNVLQQAQVAYPRKNTEQGLPVKVTEEQAKMHITCSFSQYTNDITSSQEHYRLPQVYETQSFEAYNFGIPASDFWTVQELYVLINGTEPGQTPVILPAEQVDYTNTAPMIRAIRLLSHSRILFKDNMASPAALPLGVLQSRAIPHEEYQLVFTPEIIDVCYDDRITQSMPEEGGYIDMDNDGNLWIPSGTIRYVTDEYSDTLQQFFTPLIYLDPWGNATQISFGNALNYYNFWMLPEGTKDASGNQNRIEEYDWRLLQPVRHKDHNDNISEVFYDTLGMPVAMALKGKNNPLNPEGDTLQGLSPDSTEDITLQQDFWEDPENIAPGLIKGAAWRCVYNLTQLPMAVAMIIREQHYTDNPDSPLLIQFSYSDGFGRDIMQKIQCEPTSSNDNKKWIGSGRTIYNNKGNAVMQYEPYFSDTHLCDTSEQASQQGVTPILWYDPLDRNYRTDLPDDTFTKTEWTPWKQVVWDNNDTVLDSGWYAARIGGGLGIEEQQAAQKASAHADTPTVINIDTLARGFYTIQQDSQTNFIHSFESLDIQGNRLSVTDGRGLIPLKYRYNMLSSPCYTDSIDSGTQRAFLDVSGQPLALWDTDDRKTEMVYDVLRRPLQCKVTDGTVTKILDIYTYGEGLPDDKAKNLRGQVYELYNSSGKSVIPEGYDFKGNPLETETILLEDPELTDPDWAKPPALGDGFTSSTVYDALNRPVAMTDPGGNTNEYFYDKGGVLKTVKLNGTVYVQDLHYDAKGQRQAIWYGNGTKTGYTYDEQTFRLRRLLTTKSSDIFQDLRYWYDPIGNITRINDEAQQTLYYANAVIDPTQLFTYDALYRLIEAEGREQIANNNPSPGDNWTDDSYKVALGSDATRRYTQKYTYDAVGNILKLQHLAGTGSYTRDYTVDTVSNRMLATTNGSETYTYGYDTRGNMTAMPHLSEMVWNMQNELHYIANGTLETHYQYSNGERIRKFVKKGNIEEERIYLGNYEIYRKYINGTLQIERSTVHVNDDTGRIAMLEKRTYGSATDDHSTEAELTRYIYSNHLQSASLELDQNGEIISYEEYHPYGTTSYQAKNTAINAVAKRYRYTGKERDEESGLYYYGARYYASWVGQFVSIDPLAEKYVHQSPYVYADNNSINKIDFNGEGTDENDENTPPATHTVIKGDNFWNLEKQYNLEYGTLKQYNPDVNPNKLKIGSKINLIGKGGKNLNLRMGTIGKSGEGPDFESRMDAEPETGKGRSIIRRMKLASTWSLFRYMEVILNEGTLFQETDEVAKIMDHFKSNTGEDLNSPGLAKLMTATTPYKNMTESVSNVFEKKMREAGGDYTKIKFDDKAGIRRPNFSYGDSPTLKTIVGGTQQLDFMLKSITVDIENRTYSGILKLTLYDDFGVDEPDVTNPSIAALWGQNALAAFWILQHQRGYKPFRTMFNFNIPVKGKF